jgi:hypothetical protein
MCGAQRQTGRGYVSRQDKGVERLVRDRLCVCCTTRSSFLYTRLDSTAVARASANAIFRDALRTAQSYRAFTRAFIRNAGELRGSVLFGAVLGVACGRPRVSTDTPRENY